MGLSLAQVANDLKDYAKDNEVEIIDLASEIGLSGIPGTPVRDLDDYVQIIPVDGPQDHVLADIVTSDPLQIGGNGSFNAKTYGTVGGRVIKTQPVKIDLNFTEQQIQNYFKTYFRQAEKKKFNPEEVPFEGWLIKKILTDSQKYLRVAFFKAVKGSAGANTSSLDIFDGILKHLQTDLAITPTSPVNVVEVPTISKSTVIEAFETMAAAVPTAIRYGGQGVLAVGQGLFDMYTAAYREKFGSLRYNDQFNKLTIDGTNVEIAVEEGLESFGLPIVTVKNNFGMTLDSKRMGTFEFDYSKRDRSLAMMQDFFAGVNYTRPDLIWVAEEVEVEDPDQEED